MLEPFGFQTGQRFAVKSFGLGATLAGALGPVWVAWDNNYNPSDRPGVNAINIKKYQRWNQKQVCQRL